MPNKLFASMGLSICGMVFLILVFIMYMSKKKYKALENKIYLLMFIVAFVALINEWLYIFAMYADLDAKISFLGVRPLCYLYIFFCIILFSLLIMYIWAKLYSEASDEVKKKKRTLMIIFMSIVVVVIFSISLILEIDYPTSNSHLYVFSGTAVYVLYLIGMGALLLVSVAMLIKGKNIPIYQKIPIFFCVAVLIVINCIQLFLDYDFNSLAFLFVFVITTLFFTVESQDYKLVDELEQKRNEAEIADNAQTEFLANMSHEIRTPLNTILGFSNSLLSDSNLTKETVDRDVLMIYEASNNLKDLINKMLAISKIESNKETIVEEKYNLNDLILQLSREMDNLTDKRDVKFNAELTPNIPIEYYGDYNKIHNMLLYIFENSLKYTEYGTIYLNIFASRKDNEYELVFKVLNTGTEMNKEKFNVSFTDFVKLGDKSQNTIDSSTLGLIIAKSYIELLGGTVEFMDNDINKVQYLIKISQKINDNEENEKERNKVLIVMDNSIELKTKLSKYNFVIDVSDSLNDEVVKNRIQDYDIIFLDNKKIDSSDISNFKNKIILLIDEEDNNEFDNKIKKPINDSDLDNILNRILK